MLVIVFSDKGKKKKKTHQSEFFFLFWGPVETRARAMEAPLPSKSGGPHGLRLRQRSRRLGVYENNMNKLRPREVNLIRTNYAALFRAWGYRTGRNQEHENYEDELHVSVARGSRVYGYLTPFTDALFRNLQQIATGSSLVLSGDGYYKFDRASGIDPVDLMTPVELNELDNILRRFLAEDDSRPSEVRQGTVHDAMFDLASEKLRGRTVAFATMVFAASAVLSIAERNYQDASDTVRLYIRRYDDIEEELAEEEEEEEENESFWEEDAPEMLYRVQWPNGATPPSTICAGGRVWDDKRHAWSCEHTSSASQLVDRARSGAAVRDGSLCQLCAVGGQNNISSAI